MFLSAAKDFLLSLLILCGDVESNPGPTTAELLAQLRDGQNNIQKRLDRIESKLKTVEELASLIKLSSQITGLEKTVKCLEHKLVDLEDRSR